MSGTPWWTPQGRPQLARSYWKSNIESINCAGIRGVVVLGLGRRRAPRLSLHEGHARWPSLLPLALPSRLRPLFGPRQSQSPFFILSHRLPERAPPSSPAMLRRALSPALASVRTQAPAAATSAAPQTQNAARSYATRTYGNLKDKDRIFTNLYLDGSPFLADSQKRVRAPLFRHILRFSFYFRFRFLHPPIWKGALPRPPPPCPPPSPRPPFPSFPSSFLEQSLNNNPHFRSIFSLAGFRGRGGQERGLAVSLLPPFSLPPPLALRCSSSPWGRGPDCWHSL